MRTLLISDLHLGQGGGVSVLERPRPLAALLDALDSHDRLVLLEVIDNGSGIVGGDSIFDAFVTTKSNGMGLGLALCRMIIERHQGQLSASSNVKAGARFQFILPIKTGAASIAPSYTHLL